MCLTKSLFSLLLTLGCYYVNHGQSSNFACQSPVSREYLLHFFNASTVRSGSPHTLLSSSCQVRRSRTAWERTLRRPRLIASICEWKIDKRDEITQERGRKQVRLFKPLNKVNKVSWQLYTNKAFSHALSLCNKRTSKWGLCKGKKWQQKWTPRMS